MIMIISMIISMDTHFWPKYKIKEFFYS